MLRWTIHTLLNNRIAKCSPMVTKLKRMSQEVHKLSTSDVLYLVRILKIIGTSDEVYFLWVLIIVSHNRGVRTAYRKMGFRPRL